MQAVLVEVLQALFPGPSTSPYNGIGKNMPGADSSASVVLMDGEHGRLVAALFNGDERNGWGARVRKGRSNDLPDTIPPTSLPLVTPFHRWLGIRVCRFHLEFGRSTRWGD